MNSKPTGARFTADHEWLRPDGEGTVVVGITAYAQQQLGDIVFVQLPSPGVLLEKGQEAAVIESVKAAGDIKAPLAGHVVAVNVSLVDNPQRINEDPMNDGWVMKLQLSDPSQLQSLMDESAYAEFVSSLG